MDQDIRYFKCPVPGCSTITGFDLKILNQPDGRVQCSKCKKQWTGTIYKTCCMIEVIFASIGNDPVYHKQAFSK